MITKESQNKIYYLVKGRVSLRHLENILGISLCSGLIKYKEYIGNTEIDYADILVSGLGSEILLDVKFQGFLVYNIFNDSEILFLYERIFSTKKNDSEFSDRGELLQAPRRILCKAIHDLLQIEVVESLDNENETDLFIYDHLLHPDETFRLSLHDYQKQIKDQIVKNIIENPQSKLLVHMPTGSGKTKTCIEAIIDFLRTRPFNEGIVLWFAHSNELCEQALDTLKNSWRFKGDYPLPVFKIFGDNDVVDEICDVTKGVVFIGFQKFRSILKGNKDFNIKVRTHLSTNTQLIVIDEAHKSLASTYKEALDYVSAMPNCRIIGLTATPGRSGNINDSSNSILSDYFGNTLIGVTDNAGISVVNPLEYLQNRRFLAKIDHKPIQIDLDGLSIDELNKIGLSGSLDHTDINKIVESPLRNKIIIDEITNCINDERRDLILVFACNTTHCILLKKLLEIENIDSEYVLSTTPLLIREQHIANFKSGRLKVLINYGVLSTGFDAPKLKTLIIARHTNSLILYSQMIGRALRGPLNGGNEINYVVDMIDNITQLGSPEFLFNYWEDFWGRKFITE